MILKGDNMRVVISGGGTGGHIYPALAVADRLKLKGVEAVFVGSTERMEKDLVPDSGHKFIGIDISVPRGWKNIRKYLKAIKAAFKVIKEALTTTGYHIKWKVLNGKDYGNIPQNRERIYIVGFLSKTQFDSFSFPDEIELTSKLSDVIEFDSEQDEYFYYSAEKNPFFAIVPDSFIVFQVVLATLAAIIASQSLITGSFTLISEAIKLNLFPKLMIKYPTELKGQVYVSAVNIILFICSSCVVLFFRTSSNMEAAYGLSISITMFVTTILLSIYLFKIKNNKVASIIFLSFFGAEELLFLFANSLKFVNGGYITVIIALFIFTIMFIWHKGTEIKERESQYLTVDNYKKQLLQLSSDKSIPKYATNLVYLTGAKREEDVDYAVLYSILNKQPKRANVYFFVHINVLDKPYKREYKVTKYSDKKIFKITFNLGFREHQRINMFMHQVIADLLNNKELDLQPTKYNLKGKVETVGDFRFVLINEVLGNNNGLSSFDTFIMSLRLKLKRITVTPEKWFGLDTSVTTKESVPLNVVQTKVKKLQRLY